MGYNMRVYALSESPIPVSEIQERFGEEELPATIVVGSIFTGEEQRLLVLGMLLENLGIDKVVRFGKLADWKAAIVDLEQQTSQESESESDSPSRS